MNRALSQKFPGLLGRWLTIIALVSAVFLIGCEDPAKEALMDGRKALQAGQADQAERYLEAAIEADPEMIEARRLMANVHVIRGDFELAESTLIQLWEAQGFDRDDDLTVEQMSNRQVFQKQFGALYRQWAESIDFAESPQEFERVVRTGLERNARDSRLHRLMVDFYQFRADRFIEQSEKIKAAEMLEQIDELQAFTDTRREARQRARNLRREAFEAEARQRFEETMAPDLVEAGIYDEATETIVLEARIDRPPAQEEDLEQARHMAVQALLPRLGQFAATLSDIDVEDINLAMLDVPRLTVRSEEWSRQSFTMVVTLELSALITMAFDYAELLRTHDDRGAPTDDDPAGPTTIEHDAIELDTRAVD